MSQVFRYTLLDLLRSRAMLGYAGFLLVLSLSLFALDADPAKALISLVNVLLIFLPLFCSVFATIHYYNSLEFIELLLVQPMPRGRVLLGHLLATFTALGLAFTVGVGLPVLVSHPSSTSLVLCFAGLLLTAVFTALAYLISVSNRDKARGIGIALLAWLYAVLVYDGLLLLFLYLFSDYPIEATVLPLASLNPIDLARIVVLLEIDLAALLGYTGAVYQRFFGSVLGMVYSLGLLALWSVVPVLIAVRRFARRDF